MGGCTQYVHAPCKGCGADLTFCAGCWGGEDKVRAADHYCWPCTYKSLYADTPTDCDVPDCKLKGQQHVHQQLKKD